MCQQGEGRRVRRQQRGTWTKQRKEGIIRKDFLRIVVTIRLMRIQARSRTPEIWRRDCYLGRKINTRKHAQTPSCHALTAATTATATKRPQQQQSRKTKAIVKTTRSRGGRDGKKLNDQAPQETRRQVALVVTGYLVSSSSSACRAHGRSSSLHPIGNPLYPMPTMRLS